MINDNFSHVISIYNAIKNGEEVTSDKSQLYFAIAILGDEVMRLHEEVAKENTKTFKKKK